jgi:cyclohexa-1,5-dienecarbonyl-CoA hydratase
VAEDLDAEVDRWLETDFLPRSPSSLQFACRAARLALRRAFAEDLTQLEHLYSSELMTTADAEEGIRAFLEKRAPQWGKTAVLTQG